MLAFDPERMLNTLSEIAPCEFSLAHRPREGKEAASETEFAGR